MNFKETSLQDGVVKNLAQIAHQMKIVASLEKSMDKLFTTWPTVKFGIYNIIRVL